MKRLTTLALIATIALTACNSSDSRQTFESLCKYIPDHGLADDAQVHLTESYYNAYAEAFDAPTGAYGSIGDEEWLYYFVSGNGDGEPVFKVISMEPDGDKMNVSIEIQGEPEIHEAVFVKEGGEWKLDDWDGTKALCQEYVKMMRSSYAAGTIEQSLAEDPDTAPYLDDFRKELNAFYDKYGK